MRIKHGVDPTTKDLHLGHSVSYLKLREFQELGHQIVFLIGDFTGRFGDPTQKLTTRKLRKRAEVKALAKNYLRQAGKILDLKRLEVRYNSEWYDKMSAEELLNLMSHFTVMRMLERDMFQARIKKGLNVQLHEPVYPVLQGYDSVMLKSDLTVCGVDQLFNELRGRDLQRDFGQKPQGIITVPILLGTDGKQKMSQSLGNYIKIEESPQNQYGKVMSIPDSLIGDYFELCTRVPAKEVREIKKELEGGKASPRDLKAKLAREIVGIYHSKKAAVAAEKEFERIFKEKKSPSKVPVIEIKEKSLSILHFLVKTRLVSSKSEAKRLILQKGVKIDGEIQNDWKKLIKIKKGTLVQVGKRRFVKVV